MKRRDVIRAMAATSLATIAAPSFGAEKKSAIAKWRPPALDKIVLGDSFFLSKTNPVATADQRDLQALALKVMQMPAVTKAKEAAKRRYRTLVGKQRRDF